MIVRGNTSQSSESGMIGRRSTPASSSRSLLASVRQERQSDILNGDRQGDSVPAEPRSMNLTSNAWLVQEKEELSPVGRQLIEIVNEDGTINMAEFGERESNDSSAIIVDSNFENDNWDGMEQSNIGNHSRSDGRRGEALLFGLEDESSESVDQKNQSRRGSLKR